MGDMADWYMEQALGQDLERLIEEHHECLKMEAILAQDEWVTKDGVVVKPAAGEMSAAHIQAVMNYIQKHFGRQFEQQTIHDSVLWQALRKGLEVQRELQKKAEDLNKDILKW